MANPATSSFVIENRLSCLKRNDKIKVYLLSLRNGPMVPKLSQKRVWYSFLVSLSWNTLVTNLLFRAQADLVRGEGVCVPFRFPVTFLRVLKSSGTRLRVNLRGTASIVFFCFVLFYFILVPACSSLNRAKYLRSLCSAFHIPVVFLAEQQRINNGSALGWVRERVEALYCAQAR